MKRREFITLLGSAAAAWPLAARMRTADDDGHWVSLNGASAPHSFKSSCCIPQGCSKLAIPKAAMPDCGISLCGQIVGVSFASLAVNHKSITCRYCCPAESTPRLIAPKRQLKQRDSHRLRDGVTVAWYCRQPESAGWQYYRHNFLGSEIAAKRFGLLLELVPQAGVIAVLANPTNQISGTGQRTCKPLPHTFGRQQPARESQHRKRHSCRVHPAIVEQYVKALLVAHDPFFDDRRALYFVGRATRVPTGTSDASL